jgi:hypothetical protein
MLTALQAQLPPEVANVVTMLVTSVLYSLAAYSHKWQKGEEFDSQKLLKTVLVGLGAGGIAVYFGFDPSPDRIVSIAETFGLVAVADHLSKFIWRQVSPALSDSGVK